MTTALHRLSKSDTVILLDAALADLFVDHGPERTSLDDLTTWFEESPSPRAAISAPRNVAILVNMAADDTGILLRMGDAGSLGYRVYVADGVVYVSDGSSVECEMPEPSKTPAIILIHWSTRLDDSGDIVNELALYNFTAGLWTFASGTHAPATQNPAHTLTIGAGLGGSTAYSRGVGAIYAVSIGRRFHSTTEAAEDWVNESTPPAFDGRDRTPLLTGADDLGIASEGMLAGPSLLWAGAATRQAAQRCVGPFVNARPAVPATEYVTGYPLQFYRATPDGATGWKWCIRYLWHGYLSPKVNVAQVRAHVRCVDLFGNEVISPVRFRSFSVAGLPTGEPGPAMTYYRGPIVSVTTPAPAGEWLDLGVVRLARSASGLSYFALGFLVDATEDEGAEYDTIWHLSALTVDPYTKDLETGGHGDVDEKAAP